MKHFLLLLFVAAVFGACGDSYNDRNNNSDSTYNAPPPVDSLNRADTSTMDTTGQYNRDSM